MYKNANMYKNKASKVGKIMDYLIFTNYKNNSNTNRNISAGGPLKYS